MTLHNVDFSYNLPEWGTMQIDIDASLDYGEKEEAAIQQIKDTIEDAQDVEIEEIVEVV